MNNENKLCFKLHNNIKIYFLKLISFPSIYIINILVLKFDKYKKYKYLKKIFILIEIFTHLSNEMFP